jgi:hypothetical protein
MLIFLDNAAHAANEDGRLEPMVREHALAHRAKALLPVPLNFVREGDVLEALIIFRKFVLEVARLVESHPPGRSTPISRATTQIIGVIAG